MTIQGRFPLGLTGLILCGPMYCQESQVSLDYTKGATAAYLHYFY